jgi:hypothetical protein
MASFLNIGAAATRWGEARIANLMTRFQNGRENRASVLDLLTEVQGYDFGGEQ